MQVLKTTLPCLITMLEDTNHIRFGTMDDAFRAARYKLTEWNAADAGVADVGKCGLRGSPTVVKKVFAPTAKTAKATLIEGASPEAIAEAAIDAIFTAQAGLQEDLQSHIAANS